MGEACNAKTDDDCDSGRDQVEQDGAQADAAKLPGVTEAGHADDQ